MRCVTAVGEMENGVFVVMVLQFFCSGEAKVLVSFAPLLFFAGGTGSGLEVFAVPRRPKVLVFSLCGKVEKTR